MTNKFLDLPMKAPKSERFITQEEVEMILAINFPHKKITITNVGFSEEKNAYLFKMKIGNIVRVSETYAITLEKLEQFREVRRKELEKAKDKNES